LLFILYTDTNIYKGGFPQYFPVTKVLGINICLWGIVTASTGAVQTSSQLIAIRTVLGTFEAVVTPSLIMITAAWYKRSEGVYRLSIWFCGLGAGQILGGLICFGAQHYSNTHFQAWRIIFLCIGGLNILVSGFVYRLPSSPEDATFLSATDKAFSLRRLQEDHAGVGIKVLRLRSILEVFLDLQTWLLCLITVLTTLSSGVVIYYSSFLIKGFGFNSKSAALLNMPCGAVSIVAAISMAYVVKQGYHRWLAIAIACVPALLGACLLMFLKRDQKAGLLAGTYLINTVSTISISAVVVS
jgi:sugar phosphate permease